jgi:hypothetical protein
MEICHPSRGLPCGYIPTLGRAHDKLKIQYHDSETQKEHGHAEIDEVMAQEIRSEFQHIPGQHTKETDLGLHSKKWLHYVTQKILSDK